MSLLHQCTTINPIQPCCPICIFIGERKTGSHFRVTNATSSQTNWSIWHIDHMHWTKIDAPWDISAEHGPFRCIGCNKSQGKLYIAQLTKEYIRNIYVELVEYGYHLLVMDVVIIPLTHWPLGDLKIFFKMSFSNSYPESIPWAIPAKLLSEVCHRTPLMISQHWFR